MYVLNAILGNLILNWPKLLWPLKTVFFTLYQCVCVRKIQVQALKNAIK